MNLGRRSLGAAAVKTVWAAAVFLLCFAGSWEKVDRGEEIIVDTKSDKGRAEFKHWKHQEKILERYGKDCDVCHHTSKPGEEIKDHGCRECHMPDVVKDKAPKLKEALHAYCNECHDAARKEKVKDVPKKTCKACHEKE